MEVVELLEISQKQLDKILNVTFTIEQFARHADIDKYLIQPEILIITGIRRCGKSTLLQQLIRKYRNNYKIHYLNFEDSRLKNFSFEDFQRAYEGFKLRDTSSKPELIIYDEIQEVPTWEKWVAQFASTENSKVIITGSNATLLNSELSSLLTGRHQKIELTPFSFFEIKGVENAHTKFFSFGGFPRVFTTEDSTILAQYYEDIVLKDIVLRKKVRNTNSLSSLSTILASQNTRLFNRSKIANEIGLKDVNTLNKFCTYFEETFLFKEIRSYSNSLRKQLRSLSKFYCIDPILAKSVGYFQGNTEGWILENFVFNELCRRYKKIWYWNSKKGFEIDFIVQEKSGELIAIQVCKSLGSEQTVEREMRAFSAAFQELGIEKFILITEFEKKHLSYSDIKVEAIPFHIWAVI